MCLITSYKKEYDSLLLASLITDTKWKLMSGYDHPVQLSHIINRVQFVLPGENPGCITIGDSLSSFFDVSIKFPEDITSMDALKICEDICPKVHETILTEINTSPTNTLSVLQRLLFSI